jgi:aryl-alcohol dehydrogenase-like predicted oxidoreductase
MDKRRLAGTDLDVSVVCFGPMRAARKEPGNDPRSQAGAQALRAALDCGINFFHSSYEYGVRWMMTQVLRDHPRRHDIHHVIKVPVPDWDDGGRFDTGKMRRRVEEALGELCCERIAVLQWMWRTRPNEDGPRLELLPQILDDVVACFEQLRDEGKAGHLWTFPYTAPAGRAALESGHFGGLIGYYNPLEMEMAELFPALAQRGMGFLAIRPLLEGVLTDQRSSQEALPAGDRLKDPKHAPVFRRRAALAAAFRDEVGSSMTRFALRFPLSSPLVASAIVGLNTAQQVEQVAAMMDGVEPRPELVERALAIWRQHFGEPG